MSNYWLSRYVDTLSKVASATSPRVRLAYIGLAHHYRAMYQLCGRSPDGLEGRIAA